jgi:hypothetical protein
LDEEHDHEDVILAMMGAFEQEFHGIRFQIPDGSYYETMEGLSWGVNPTYAHEWNGAGDSEVKLQISRRETPTLAPARLPQLDKVISISCLSLRPKSAASRFPKFLPKKSALVISATRRAIFMT